MGAAARCGTLPVFENRETREGRTFDLNVVVLPARGEDAAPMFSRSPLGNRRDFVLVDQRGTGKSDPLDCPARDLQEMFDSISTFVIPGIEACRGRFDADLKLYTTTFAMADLDDVRSALGYETINLRGCSRGSRNSPRRWN